MRNSVINTGGVTYDQIFRAIGDPHRLQILILLREKELSAGEILKALDIVQSTLSHHMKSLVDAGVVTASRHGKWTYYSLNAEILTKAAAYLGDFTGGTKIAAQFAQKESAVVQPETPAPQPVRPLVHESGKQESKSSKQKEDNSAGTGAREEKKKSKKGKKGKKNKK